MKAVWLGGVSTNPSTSATGYAHLTSGLECTFSTTERARANAIPDDAEILRLQVWVDTAPGAGKSRSFGIRDDVADTIAALTISDTATYAEWNGSVSIAAGSMVTLRTTPTGTPAAPGIVRWVVTYQTAGNFYLMLSGNQASPGDYATRYGLISGAQNGAMTTSATASAQIAPTGFTVTKMGFVTGGSSFSGGFNISVGKNAMAVLTDEQGFGSADGNAAIRTFTTPLHVDPADTVQVRSRAPGGSTAWNAYSFAFTVVPDVGGEIALLYSDTVAPSTSAVTYQAPNAKGTNSWGTVETAAQIRVPAAVLTKLFVALVTAPGAGKSRTFMTRVAAASTTLAATVADTNTVWSNTGDLTPTLDGSLVSVMNTPAGTPAATSGVKIGLVLVLAQDVAGTMDGTLRPMVADLASAQTLTGQLAATLQRAVLAATGAQIDTGTIQGTLKPTTAALTGAQAQTGAIAATFQRIVAQASGTQAQIGAIAAQLKSLLFFAATNYDGQISGRLQRLGGSLIGAQSDALPTQPTRADVLFAFSGPLLIAGIVSANQIVTLRTARGVQLDQWLPEDQIGLTWSMEGRETSRCELTVINDGIRPEDVVPWLHWVDVFDDSGQLLLWSGPVTARSIGRDQVSISARDTSALAARTRTRLTKRWDATDPAVIAGEHYAQMIDHHGLNTRAIVRPDPMGETFDFASKADETQTDAVIEQLVGMGLHWAVVRGVPILGPWDRAPVADLGEDDFINGGITLTCDGTTTYNDILLRGADNLARAIVPMGGLALQQTVSVDDMFGVSNVDKAVQQYARYSGSMRDTISLAQGAILHPDAPVGIDQLIPSARLTVTAFDQTFLMEVTRVEVTGGDVALTLGAVDDDLPELVELQQRGKQ